MDKKRLVKSAPQEDLKGFEEFIESQPDNTSFMTKQAGTKKEVSFEHFTFLTNDANRLNKMKDLLMDKIPFATKYEQGDQLVKNQTNEIATLRKHIYELSNKPDSSYRKSIAEIFNSFFEPPKT